MKRSNYIVLGIAVAVSLFLLWLWWYLGFAKVDGPSDVFITLAWWIVIALVGYGIYRFEQRRRRQMRTVYLSNTSLFNCECGLLEFADFTQRAFYVEQVVKSLRYGFDFKDMPDRSDFDCSYIVRTEDYKDSDNWHGTVVKVNRGGGSSETSFDSLNGLAQALK